ncbi:MAG: hypothetical protein Ta2G_19050 [Termitinemataceae bacterium]|nr:MAG: hypothetical protein Ta2G_19050 [Termitinemataceae bacterium]
MRDNENKKIRIKDVIELFYKISTIIFTALAVKQCIGG